MTKLANISRRVIRTSVAINTPTNFYYYNEPFKVMTSVFIKLELETSSCIVKRLGYWMMLDVTLISSIVNL